MSNFDHVRSRGMGMNRFAIAALLLAGIASATEVMKYEDSLAQEVESLDARKGLEIGGTVRAVFNRSNFSSDQDINGINMMPDREQNEFTQLDLRLGFRPWQATRANVIIRMGAGMQDYFIAASKSVSVPWMNLDGRIGDKFYWVAGDFRQQYTPLTLWSPDLEILYEPEVYRRDRHMARDQVFLQGNQRNLQGVNLQYRDEFGDAVGEVRVEGIFSRLRRVENLDFSGATGNMVPNGAMDGASQASGMDKYMAALNLEAYPASKRLMVGATQMFVWDNASSLTREYRINSVYCENANVLLGSCTITDDSIYYRYEPINPWDTLPQKTSITSLRVGFDAPGFLGNSNLILDGTLEYAMSKDDVYDEGFDYTLDPVTGLPMVLTNSDGVVYDSLKVPYSTKSSLDGSAILGQLNVGYKITDSWMARLSGDYISNDSGWFNNLAQSPSFFPRRILNSEKDANASRWGVNSPLYTTFDAMYHFTPKFSPVATSLANDDNNMAVGQTESYNIAPYAKNSWTTAVMTRKELALAEELSDPNVQLALPNGLATANRTGFRANVLAGYGKDNAVEIQGLFTQLQQVAALGGAGKADYNEVGGGAKVDIFRLIGFELPFELSGSYKESKRKQDGAELKSDFINAGAYVRYHKRFGVAAGFQRINMKLNDAAAAVAYGLGVDIPLVEGVQTQWMAGLDYTLARNAWLAVNFGVVNVENTYHSADAVVDAENLPDYITVVNPDGITDLVHKFSQNLIDCSINVEF